MTSGGWAVSTRKIRVMPGQRICGLQHCGDDVSPKVGREACRVSGALLPPHRCPWQKAI